MVCPFVHAVLMNCLTCGFYTLRKFIEIVIEKSGVISCHVDTAASLPGM